jgi:hypothetical protein
MLCFFIVIQVSFPVGIAPQIELWFNLYVSKESLSLDLVILYSLMHHIWQPWGLASEVVHCQMSGLVIFWGHCFQILFQNGLSSTGQI